MTPEAILTERRIVRAAAIAFGVTSILAITAFVIVSTLRGDAPFFGLALVFAAFPFIAAQIPLVFGMFSFNAHVKSALQGADVRRVALVVLRGRSLELDASDEAAAARYAPIAAVAQRLQAVSIVLTDIGTLCALLGLLSITSDFRVPLLIVCAVLIASAVLGVPIVFRQARRAKRYAATHPA